MTSIFGGFVIFSYLGYMAGQLKTDVSKVAADGPGLVFVIYPAAMNQLPGAPFWSVIFFFMLITLGLDSQFAMVETVLTGVCDSFPDIRKYKTPIILGICIVGFLLGLPMTTQGGVYVLQIMDNYVAAWSLLMIGLCEVLAITHVYGWRRFCKDIELMIGSQPSIFWKVTWLGSCPVGITFILLFAWIDYSPVVYGDYAFPKWADGLGWLMAIASVIWIPIVMVRKLFSEKETNNLLGKFKLLLLPSRIWGPALVKHRKLIDYVDEFVVDPDKEDGHLNRGYSWSSIMSSQKAGSELSVPSDVQSRITKASKASRTSNVTAASKITYESNI